MNTLTLMQELKPQLEAEGFAVFYQEATADNTIDQLIVPLAKEDGTAVNIEINTLLDPQNLYPQTQFIQCFIAIPIQVSDKKTAEIHTLLNSINCELPMGSFQLHQAGIIFYKYTLVISHSDKENLFSRLIDSIDISNHLFQSHEPHILSLI